MIRAYFNERAAAWDKTVAEKDTRKPEHMAKRLGLEPGSTVLDIGTGTGVFLPYLLAMIGEKGRVVGLDVADRMLQQACRKEIRGVVHYVCGDIMTVPCDDELFDTVVCYSSFPHFQDKPRAFREIYRVLKNSGRLLVCHTNSRIHINGIHSQLPTVSHDLIPGNDEMMDLLHAAGFRAITIEDSQDSYLVGAQKPV
ncbi:MAG TPA: class I SAM-dependent methyltransferase [Dehalococcoidia bacterium]|nr:class I SAM-dependent methyltransferase [Dehalococcoidia bacterium]